MAILSAGFASTVFAGINTSGVCIPGTINTTNRTCQVYLGGYPITISYCAGDETSGPCRPVRIDPNAANQLAVAAKANLDKNGYTDSSCTATMSPFPGIDPNTGLSYFMNTECKVSGIPGFMAENLLTSQGIAALGCDLVHAGVTSAKCSGSSGSDSGSGSGSGGSGGSSGGQPGTGGNSNLEGISAQTQSQYFSGGFNPTSGRDQATAIQLRATSYARSVTEKAFNDFENFITGKPVGANSLGITSANQNIKPTADETGKTVSARYIKIDMTRAGWVAVREIEAYDENGTKISMSGASATASCTWCNYGSTPPGVEPSSAIDGNIETMWNAGETASNCNWFTPDANGNLGCPSSTLRSAWIVVDLGSVKTLSKIRYSTTDNTNESDILSVSVDNKSWTKLATFIATPSLPFSDKQWHTWPEESNSNSNNPISLSFTTDKGDNPSLHSGGDGLIMKWDVSNADMVEFSVSGQNPQCIPYGEPDPYKWKSFPYAKDNSVGIHGLGTQFSGTYFWKDFFTCEKNRSIAITLKAKQTGGASASKTVTISVDDVETVTPRVIDNPYLSGQKWGYNINANYQEFFVIPGTSTSNNSFTGQPVIIQTNVDAAIYPSPSGGITAAYPFPVITGETNDSSVGVTLGSQTDVPIKSTDAVRIVSSKTQPYTMKAVSGASSGVYKIRIYGNKGKTDQGYIDIPVFITKTITTDASGLKQTVIQATK